jgi:hypothetical protein
VTTRTTPRALPWTARSGPGRPGRPGRRRGGPGRAGRGGEENGAESGEATPLPAPPPLRTARAPFDACSSSIGQRPCETRAGAAPPVHDTSYGTRSPHWPWGRPERYYGSAGYREDFGGGCSTSNGHYGRADISASQPTPVG